MTTTDPDAHTVLNPGTYCGGLQLEGDVTLNPGIYHVKDGTLVFGSTSNIKGEDLTFVLSGVNSRLHMKEGAKATIQASRSGELGGVAFYQVPNRTSRLPEERSLVKSGGDLNVNGVFYFPTQEVFLTGDAKVGAKSDATSFIAYRMQIRSDVRSTIEVDHEAAGIPAMHPRVDESARLVTDHLQ